MNRKMLQAAVHLGQYARGEISYLDALTCLQASGYPEQTAIFILELLEDVEPVLHVPDPNAGILLSEPTGEEDPHEL